jgi:hypothetical protein
VVRQINLLNAAIGPKWRPEHCRFMFHNVCSQPFGVLQPS